MLGGLGIELVTSYNDAAKKILMMLSCEVARMHEDIANDPHMAERRDLVPVNDPVLGPVVQQAPFPRFVGESAPVPTGAPTLGQDNDEVWGSIVGPAALDSLRAANTI